MTRGTIRIIILLATVIFIGLLSTQIFWVRKAYEITDLQLRHEIEQSLINVVHDIQKHRGDSTFLVDPVKMISPNFYRVQINEELQPYYLESLLKTEFLNRELNFQFQFSIYNCFNDSVVYSKVVANDEDLGSDENKMDLPPIQWDDDGHYFSVFFPTLNMEVASALNFWIISSIVLIIVLVFFAYVINVIMKQKRLSEIKTDFINNMTHELKTPISTIALSSEVLLQKGIVNEPERLENYAGIIKKENQRLQNQVERVLQMAKLDKDEIELKKKEVDIVELIELAVPTLELNFSDKNLEIDLDLAPQDHIFYADEMHLISVLYNLLDNAAKYGGDQPKITIKAGSTDKGIWFSIKDNGPGMTSEQQKHIFEKFYRIPTGNVHNVKGFGIGLHYVKSIVEVHGGKVSVKSSPGKGSEFFVSLPFGMELEN